MKTVDLSGLTKKDKVRFWAKVDKSGNCWNWIRGKGGTGYGSFSISNVTVKSHRIAYEIMVGHVPPGMCVLHSCDNTLCCNPVHLFLGTHRDNNLDMRTKGHDLASKGERHYRAKLKVDQVKDIRSRHASGTRAIDLAREYFLTDSGIDAIIHRRTWKHI